MSLSIFSSRLCYALLHEEESELIPERFKEFSSQLSKYDASEVEDVYDVSFTLWLFMNRRKFIKESENTKWSYRVIYFICRLYFQSKDKTIKASALMMLGQILLRCQNYIPDIFYDLAFEFEPFFRGKHPIEKLNAIVVFCYEQTKNCIENININSEISTRTKRMFGQFLDKLVVDKKKLNDYRGIDVVEMMSLIFDYLSRYVSKKSKNQFLLYAKQNILFSAPYWAYSSPSELFIKELQINASISIYHVDDDTITISISGVNEELIPRSFTWSPCEINIKQGLGIIEFSQSLFQKKHQFLSNPYEPSYCQIYVNNNRISSIEFNGVNNNEQFYQLILSEDYKFSIYDYKHPLTKEELDMLYV